MKRVRVSWIWSMVVWSCLGLAACFNGGGLGDECSTDDTGCVGSVAQICEESSRRGELTSTWYLRKEDCGATGQICVELGGDVGCARSDEACDPNQDSYTCQGGDVAYCQWFGSTGRWQTVSACAATGQICVQEALAEGGTRAECIFEGETCQQEDPGECRDGNAILCLCLEQGCFKSVQEVCGERPCSLMDFPEEEGSAPIALCGEG